MKKTLFISVFTLVSFSSIAQSVVLSPNNLQIPRVSALPACATADYGKIVFLTTTNRANVCSGSGWVEVAAGGGGGGSLTLPYSASGTFATQGFQVTNAGGGVGSSAIQANITSTLTNTSALLGSAEATNPSGETVGVKGINSSTNNNGIGVKGTHDGAGYGVYGYSLTGTGVYGTTQGSSSSGYGVQGQAGQTSGVGVFGHAFGINGVAVWGKADQSTGMGGYFQNTAVGGIALVTAGKVRFQGNGAGINKVLVSTDVNGTAEWKDITKNEVLKLSAAAFSPHLSTNGYVMGSQGISLAGTGSVHADVSVPNGATINSFKIYYIDNDGTSPSTGLGITGCSLQQITHTGTATYTNVASITVNNTVANANIQTQNVFPSIVVDNSINSYRVVVSMPATSNVVLVAIELGYTYKLN
ncbi:hypothetical protein [Emticicia oligotrophica]|uniref:hypothetical protein n=1 Tax=Emticicia oligotrophica TaxID=312279 RepID=UPI00273AC2F5|nr:hypothetical protein [Emticicia oligotrophica]